jgi:uncharacterized protein (DUF2062 family)
MPRPRHDHHHTRWGKLIHNPNLWHLNRHSVARGIALGVFWSFTPLPFGQTLFSTLLAVRLRANVALAAAFTWVCNPLTLAPTFYLSYTIGRLILRQPQMPDFEPTKAWFKDNFPDIWLPYGLGALVLSCTMAALTYVISQEYWKWRTARRWQQRGHRVRVPEEVGV